MPPYLPELSHSLTPTRCHPTHAAYHVQTWLRCWLMCMVLYFGVGGLWAYYTYYAFGEPSSLSPGVGPPSPSHLTCRSLPLPALHRACTHACLCRRRRAVQAARCLRPARSRRFETSCSKCACRSGPCRSTPCCPRSQSSAWSRAGRWPTRGEVQGGMGSGAESHACMHATTGAVPPPRCRPVRLLFNSIPRCCAVQRG